MLIDPQSAATHYGREVVVLDQLDHFNPQPTDEERIYVAPIGDDMWLPFYCGMGCKTNQQDVVRLGFHGAKVGIPWQSFMFAPVAQSRQASAPFILFDDPTLYLDRDFRLCWYIGTPRVDPFDAMTEVAKRIASATGATRFLTMGSSGGGFAAARMALSLPDAVAVSVAPQTDAFRYHLYTHLQMLLSRFWRSVPQGKINDTFGYRFRLRDAIAHANWEDRHIIRYLQNSGDSEHVRNHLRPLLWELGANHEANAIPEIELYVSRPYIGVGHINTPIAYWETEATLGLDLLSKPRAVTGISSIASNFHASRRAVNLSFQFQMEYQ